MKITIEVVGSVFRVEIDNQPETANETLGGTGDDCSHGKGGAWPPQEGASNSLGNDSLSVVTAGETAPRSDGGLNIVHKHTEIQANPEEVGQHGETASVPAVDAGSRPVAGRSATATSEDGRDSLERQAPNVSVLRPHCKNPTTCGGYGDKHCHSCLLRVIREDAA